MPQATPSYEELSNSEIKLAVLLYGLSYPAKPEIEYWRKWAKKPLHPYVLTIIRGLNEHRQRIIRLNNERDHIQEQLDQLAERTMTPEDMEQIRKFLRKEYLLLVKAEKEELDLQLAFLEKQAELIQVDIAKQEESQNKEWQELFNTQIKKLKKEFKKLGLGNEFKSLLNEHGVK